MTRPFTVTFARGFGTGGKEIASRLAKELGIHCYENRILTLASQLSGLDHELFVEVDEKIRQHSGFSAFLAGLPRSRKYISREEPFAGDQQLFDTRRKSLRTSTRQSPAASWANAPMTSSVTGTTCCLSTSKRRGITAYGGRWTTCR